MEVETHSLSAFDLKSPSLSYATSNGLDHPELRNHLFRSSEMAGSSDDPELDALESSTAGGTKCEGLTDQMVSALSWGAASPTRDSRESEGSVVSGEAAPNNKLDKCSSDAAMKVQKVYRGYRTRRMLADSAVVAEELWWQVLDYARLNHSTISFFNFLKPETPASRWNRVSLNASKVGKGLSKDAKAQKLAFQHWIEAIDPRHRYGHSLHIYYEEWCKTDAGQPFFFWLDLGDGKEVDLEECPRSKLRQQCIKYLGPQEREHYEYMVIEGKMVHKQNGDLLDTTKGKPGAKWIFVMSTSKRLYAGEKKKGMFHHSSFLAGGATLAAGRLVVKDGVLESISAYSGHYRPTEDSLAIFLQFLRENGVNLNDVEIGKANEDYETSEEGKSIKGGSNSEDATISDSSETKLLKEVEEDISQAAIENPEASISYKRTLSGGLRSPKAEVPQTAILQRINSKKAATSYQLGHQLTLKWSTGVGPRIGCIADYPLELRLQALEMTNLSPRPSSGSAKPLTPGKVAPLVSSVSCPSQQLQQLVEGDIRSWRRQQSHIN